MGVGIVHLGDTHLAGRYLNEFLRRPFLVVGEKRCIAAAKVYLSLVARQRRDHSMAVPLLAQAAKEFRALGLTQQAVICEKDLAWVRLMDNQLVEAAPHLKAVKTYVKANPDDHDTRADYLALEALNRFCMNDLLGVAALCEEIFTPGRPGVTDLHLAEAGWLMDECMLQVNRYEEAKIFANLAVNHAMASKWVLGINLASSLRRRVLEQTGAA